MAAVTAAAVPERIDLDELIDRPLIRKWLLWGMAWVMFMPAVGVLISGMFTYADYAGTSPYLTFGRLRPVHVNGVIFGAFSTLFFGLTYYIVPRLTGVKLVWPRLGHWMAWAWNLTLIAGLASLVLGYNQGLEAGEFPLLVDLAILGIVGAITAQLLLTIARRRFLRLYVSTWYLIAALVWTVLNLVLGTFIVPYTLPGINNAAFHGLFIHYIVGLWITPAGYVLIYYFLPVAAKNPIYSHKLSLVGFWSLALFYPFVGIHHYLYSPIADWAETISIITSMLLIIPVWTVLVNFFGTMNGRWHTFSHNLTAKFLIMGSIMYLFGCFQGSVEALRSIQQPTHFTDFVISHSHLTVFGTFVVWALAGLIYTWPRIHGRELWSFRLANGSFWLITAGISLMGLGLTAQGLQQGFAWMSGVEWLDTVNPMKPYWLVRTVAGISMDLGITLLVYNMIRTAWQPAPREVVAPSGVEPLRPGARPLRPGEVAP